MIIEMLPGASAEQIEAIERKVLAANERYSGANLQPCTMRGAERYVIGVAGWTQTVREEEFYGEGVEKVVRITEQYKLVGRKFHPNDTVVDVSGVKVGGENLPVIWAGPCAAEGESEIHEVAYPVKNAGAHILRGGARKPRTSPYAYQGIGQAVIDYLANAGKEVSMPVDTEATGEDQDNVFYVAKMCDVIHIGARNGQNFELLKKAGRLAKEYNRAVLLKRNAGNTVEEFLCAAEYVATQYLGSGNALSSDFYLPIILCPRGISTYELVGSDRRNTADLDSIVELREKTHLPIIFDPSHSSGKREYVRDLSRGAIALGAHGLMVETHLNPSQAMSDPRQQVTPDALRKIVWDSIAFFTTRKVCDKY